MKQSNLTRDGKRGTAAQDRAWGAFGGASHGWGDLTEEQDQAGM